MSGFNRGRLLAGKRRQRAHQYRQKMHSSDCVSRCDRIISDQRQLKRLPAARLHRKTDVIPDYNVTAVSRRFTIGERTIFDRAPCVPVPAVPSYARPTTSIILKAYQPDYGRDAAMLNENELAEHSVKYYSLPFHDSRILCILYRWWKPSI